MKSEWEVFHAVSIGTAHLEMGKVCQDAAASGTNVVLSYAAVSDGHGGNDYFRSDRGSQFAVASFKRVIARGRNIVNIARGIREDNPMPSVDQLVQQIIEEWNRYVDADIANQPFQPEEMKETSPQMTKFYRHAQWRRIAYGTTLIGFVVVQNCCFGIQIGDGTCVALTQQGEYIQPIAHDTACFKNITTSLCDPQAREKFRVYTSQSLPVAVFVGTDGIDNSFVDDKALYKFYNTIVSGIAEMEPEQAAQQLAQYLPLLSKEGSRDDMAVGMLFRTGQIRKMFPAPKQT